MCSQLFCAWNATGGAPAPSPPPLPPTGGVPNRLSCPLTRMGCSSFFTSRGLGGAGADPLASAASRSNTSSPALGPCFVLSA